MAAAAAQAVAVEWGMGRVGVSWSDPNAPPPTGAAIARRAASGAGLGLAVFAALFVAALATGGASISRTGFDASSFVVGAVTSGLFAMRDEIALHGLVMRVMVHAERDVLRLLACGLTSAGAALGEPHPTATSVLASAFGGIAVGALWLRDRGAWKAWGAHTAFRFGAGALVGGALWDVRTRGIAGGDLGLASSTLGVIVLGVAAVVAVALVARSPKKA